MVTPKKITGWGSSPLIFISLHSFSQLSLYLAFILRHLKYHHRYLSVGEFLALRGERKSKWTWLWYSVNSLGASSSSFMNLRSRIWVAWHNLTMSVFHCIFYSDRYIDPWGPPSWDQSITKTNIITCLCSFFPWL